MNDVTIPGPGAPSDKPRRAHVADVRRLEDQVRALTAQLARMELVLASVKPDNPDLPMTRDYFMALCIIGTLQSGGWQQIKYLKQRASQAYDTWIDACRPTPVPEALPEPEPAGLV